MTEPRPDRPRRTLASRLGARLGTTEGGAISLIAGLTLVVVLTLAGLPPALREVVVPVATQVPRADSPPTPNAAIDPPMPLDVPAFIQRLQSAPAGPPPADDSEAVAEEGTSTTEPEVAAPCPAEAIVSAARDVLVAAEGAVGVVPAEILTDAIAVGAGCSDTDPTLILLGLLTHVALRIPPTGLPPISLLPPIALPAIPAELQALLGPLGPVLDPACTQLGGAAAQLAQILAPLTFLPFAFGELTGTMFQLVGVCADLTG